MKTPTIALLVTVLSLNALLLAQQPGEDRLKELIAKFPTPAKKDGTLFEIDKAATDAALAELLKEPDKSITRLVALLSPKGGDTQARHAIHAMVMRVGAEKEKAARQTVARALAVALDGDRPKPIQSFVIGQLQLVGTDKEAAALGKKLVDADLAETAAQALLAIQTGAADQFRDALQKVAGKQRIVIVHGLGTLRDKASADAFKKLLDDEDPATRLTAAWALANLPDAAAADRLLKLADAAKGAERSTATDACFILAERLLAEGDKTAARAVYTRLHESRTEKAEKYVKDAAAKGIEKTK